MASDTYTFPFPCMTSPRPRFGRGRVFMPKDYQEWKANVRALITPGAEMYGKCRVHLYLYEAHEGKDGDNMLKSVLDAIQGVLIQNDNLKCVRSAGFTYDPDERGGFSIVIESTA